MSNEGINLERKGGIAVLTIDRPQRMNTFNEYMFSCVEKATGELKKNMPRCLVITGAGNKAFSAGFDVNPDNPMVSDIAGSAGKRDSAPAERVIGRIRKAVDDLFSLPMPIIAAVNGLAYGGGAELSVRCDMRVIDPDAVICFSEVRMGLMPDWGGGPALVRLIGSSKAADLILTARRIEAGEALNMGLANRVSKPGHARKEAISLAELIAANGPRAVSHALEVIRQSMNLSFQKALDLEAEKAVSLIMSGECIYGVAAFLEKKEPEFPDIV